MVFLANNLTALLTALIHCPKQHLILRQIAVNSQKAANTGRKTTAYNEGWLENAQGKGDNPSVSKEESAIRGTANFSSYLGDFCVLQKAQSISCFVRSLVVVKL